MVCFCTDVSLVEIYQPISEVNSERLRVMERQKTGRQYHLNMTRVINVHDERQDVCDHQSWSREMM